MASSHVIATLRLLSTVEGGRKTPFVSGYRPQFHFMGEGPGWVVQIDRCEPDPFPTGEEGVIELSFASWEKLQPRLQIGTAFEIKEGFRVLGQGVITAIHQVQ